MFCCPPPPPPATTHYRNCRKCIWSGKRIVSACIDTGPTQNTNRKKRKMRKLNKIVPNNKIDLCLCCCFARVCDVAVQIRQSLESTNNSVIENAQNNERTMTKKTHWWICMLGLCFAASFPSFVACLRNKQSIFLNRWFIEMILIHFRMRADFIGFLLQMKTKNKLHATAQCTLFLKSTITEKKSNVFLRKKLWFVQTTKINCSARMLNQRKEEIKWGKTAKFVKPHFSIIEHKL